jgi:diguanylate cyclase (GGDEF)-like protein/PAS domain S-box-containing protein
VLDGLLIALATGVAVWAYLGWRFKREKEKLLESQTSEARFRRLTELTADWFWETDAEHRITWISGGSSAATFFGTTPTYGTRFWEIPGVAADPAALDAHRERLARQLNFFDLEISRADERGARQTHIVSGSVRRTPEGVFLGYRGVGRDVTEQRSAERALAMAKERLELALGAGNLAEWDYDLVADEMYLGTGWAKLLGREPMASIAKGADLVEYVHVDDRAAMMASFVRALKGEAPYVVDYRVRVEGGGWRWLHSTGRVTERDALGRAKRMLGTVADIDERKRAEAALAEREKRFRDIAEASCEYVWETDAQWRYTYLSERVETMLGYARSELLGRRPREFMPLGEARAADEWFARNSSDGKFRDFVHRSLTRAGGVIWQSVCGVAVRDEDGNVAGWRGTSADVTLRKQAEARIEYLATRDALTGLPNRTLLADRAGQAVLAAARSRTSIALLCVDIDRFKLVNDSLGHQAGDAMLRAVAERLQGALREATLARLGEDDFVVLQPIASEKDAGALAARVLALLARPFAVEGRSLNAGASIGISLYPGDGRDFAELLKNAGAALHHAKEAGGGAIRFFSPAIHSRSAEKLRVENELRGALARGELILHWQPVVRGRGELVGAEALVRWQHPERGLIGPEEFVPLAEASGMIRAVGEWTLERALSQAGAWRRKLQCPIWFSVNVSAAELAQGSVFIEKVRSSLAANGLDGTSLELEVTERVLMSHLDENIETLRRLGELGVRFAIDDFGTGYSSLAYLRELPIDKLKIDRSFLRDIESHPADEAIVQAIAVLARTLGIAVMAEGVENDAQLERLLALGCNEWQGHLFSGPMDPLEFEKLLRRYSQRPAGIGRPA